MNAALNISNNAGYSKGRYTRMNFDNLMLELDHYRNKAKQLQKVNELHARLAGAIDLSSMIEAFSIWLSNDLEHDLIAFKDLNRGRTYMYCSGHGPEKRVLMESAEMAFEENSLNPNLQIRAEGEYCYLTWNFSSQAERGCLVISRYGSKFEEYELQTFEDSISIVEESLIRAIGYENLYKQARVDKLTGLANRWVFEERIGLLIENAKRHNHPLSLICMDLDNFKAINDTLGHAEGDKALKMAANVFSNMIRSTDLLIRMGGDEFLLVLPETKISSAKLLADRLCKAVDGLDVVVPDAGKLGVSIGLAQWQAGQSKDAWMQRADEALYEAKAAGKSQACAA